ncbi:hypothetical protein EC957_008837 [Mortierella hygrophila]|uniref:Transglutaminase-like domain-containing protein n=1 Tax=Mortierella hygrophila TaxID=979708 RepID=A0A9P6K5D8_9FUNG|nr:hypothetical protein EC957_008837 [Mortierella hygrophila]
MYSSSTTPISTSNAPVPALRPKSEVVVSLPQRSLPPPPPVPVPATFAALSTADHLHVPTLPKRPMPSLPSATTLATPPRIPSEASIIPPKRPFPSPATSTANASSSPSPVAPPRLPLPLPPRAAPTPILLVKPDTSAPTLPTRSMDTHPSVPSRPVQWPRPVSTVQLAKPPPRPISTISTSSSSSIHSGPSSPQPPAIPDHNERPFPLTKRPVPHLPPTPEAAVVEELRTRRPIVPIHRSQSISTAVPIMVPLRHVPAAVPEESDQQESPPASQSVAELLKKLDVGRQNGGSLHAPVLPAPSKPPRLPNVRVPSPPTNPTTTTTTTTTKTKTRTAASSTTSTRAVEPVPTPAPVPRPVPRPAPAPPTLPRVVPEPPTLPQRPTLPARPALPQRPILPQRADPAIPPRPELPARPALPKRPGQSTVHGHQSSSSSHSSSTTRTSNGPSGEQRVQKSSHCSATSSSSFSSSTFRPGDDAMEALSRCKPATTAEFNGERLDLANADFSVIDQHAVCCPREEEESIPRLSWYLTSAFPDDQVAQLRAIFKWMANNIIYNVAGFLSNNLGDNSAEAVLRTKTGVCAGFANLFYELAAPANLGVIKVFGVARGFGIEAGGESLGGPHAWNAVMVNGEGFLIDSTWGAGPITESGKLDPDPEARFQPHYFLVRPEELIFSHWPTNTREQFLDPPIHVDLYRALPFRFPPSWTLGILPSGTSATHSVWTDDDYAEVEVRLVKRAWDKTIPTLACTLTWKPTGEQHFAHARWLREDADSVYMTIRCFCPSAGEGELRVAGQASDSTSNYNNLALSYRVVNRGNGANMQPMFQLYMLKSFGFSIMEPSSARISSGQGKQTIRVKVFNVKPGSQPRLCVVGGMIPMPDILKQVEPGLYETQKTLRPGKYTIGQMGIGIEFLTTFEVV